MTVSKEKKGELYVLLEASLWGLFPVVTVLTQAKLPSLIILGFGSLFSCFFFALVMTVRKKWHELTQRQALVDILLATGILGILFYILFIFGLKYTSPGNAGIIELTQIFFSYLFFHTWRKETVLKPHIIGAILVVIGVLIIFYPNVHGLHLGDVLILLAAGIAPFGNFFQRRARKYVSSETILFIRSLISSILIFLLAYLFHNTFSYANLRSVFVLVLINGVLLLGYSKILWIESIHRISVMKANALSSIAPLLTLFYAWILLHRSPTIYQIMAFVPIFIGVLFLSKKNKDLKEVLTE